VFILRCVSGSFRVLTWAVALPVIWLVYPEVAGRSLEEVNLLFTSNSLLVSENMKEYHKLVEEAGGNVAVAERRLLDLVDAEVEGGIHHHSGSSTGTEKEADIEHRAAGSNKDGAYAQQLEK
jgi:hypothetical protein